MNWKEPAFSSCLFATKQLAVVAVLVVDHRPSQDAESQRSVEDDVPSF